MLSIEYVVKQEKSPREAKVFENQMEAGLLTNEGRGTFELVSNDNRGWMLTNKVDGEFRPFSMIVRLKTSSLAQSVKEEESWILKIRDHLFQHNRNFYMLGSIPEGKPHREFMMGKRFICRLINFPFSDIDEVDAETRSRLRILRGLPVGEMYGIGSTGFHIRIESELQDIGLPLAASSYLIYSTP